MTKQQLIGLLSADLARERFHLAFYLRAASVVRGLHREELSEFFMKQAASEMDHVKEFQNLLLELGGEVTDTWDFSLADRPGGLMASSDYPENILEFALKMEDEVVEEYVARMEDAAKVGGADGVYVSLFLEDQIMDSKTDAANIRRMLPKKQSDVSRRV